LFLSICAPWTSSRWLSWLGSFLIGDVVAPPLRLDSHAWRPCFFPPFHHPPTTCIYCPPRRIFGPNLLPRFHPPPPFFLAYSPMLVNDTIDRPLCFPCFLSFFKNLSLLVLPFYLVFFFWDFQPAPALFHHGRIPNNKPRSPYFSRKTPPPPFARSTPFGPLSLVFLPGLVHIPNFFVKCDYVAFYWVSILPGAIHCFLLPWSGLFFVSYVVPFDVGFFCCRRP